MTQREIEQLIIAIGMVGVDNPMPPVLSGMDIFRSCVSGQNANLDEHDGCCTRRELIARFLLLCAVLDQGPDIAGIRKLVTSVINDLYRKEVRIFHTPIDFFREINISAEEIMATHSTVKADRAEEWARVNKSTASKYNLYLDGTKQILNYAIFRWGVPLALPYFLDKQNAANGVESPSSLLDYLERYDSAEIMSSMLKDHEKYGLGKAIGDKACHLFAKWMVSSFALIRRKDEGWGAYSYEVPYDSNAGRILWRTGYLLNWASEEAYVKNAVIQKGGKKGKNYLRVTNIRGMKTDRLSDDSFEAYADICVNHMKTHKKKPRTAAIQRVQHVYLMQNGVTPAAFDDGLIHIGREYCFNHDSPNCKGCPINAHCAAYNGNRRLITDYAT